MTIEGAGATRQVGLVSLIGLVLIPLLIAGGFLWATWNSDTRLGRIQAAIVNLDEPVTLNGQLVPLGRQLAGGLVTGGTSDDDGGIDPDRTDRNFSWLLTDEEDAADGLATGRYAAVVTIPKDFSANATSFGKTEAAEVQPARIGVRTSDVSGIADSAVGQIIAATARSGLNTALTEQYLTNIYVGFNTMGEQFVTLADAATKLSDGSRALADGIGRTADGASQFASGLGELDDGTQQAASGARQLSAGADKLADGLDTFADQTAELPKGARELSKGSTAIIAGTDRALGGAITYIGAVGTLRHGTAQRPGGTADLAAGSSALAAGVAQYEQTLRGLQQLTDAELGGVVPCPLPADQCPIFYAGLRAGVGVGAAGFADGTDAQGHPRTGLTKGTADLAAGVGALDAGIGTLTANGAPLVDGLKQLRDGTVAYAKGVRKFADGVEPLHAGLAKTSSGASQLASGVDQMAGGIAALADGAHQSAVGADKLSAGLTKLADGSDSLADGTKKFADGVAEGKDKVPSYDSALRERLSSVVATPVRADAADSLFADDATTTFLAVIALWIGALATYVVVRAVSARVLVSSAPSWRLALQGLAPGAAIAAVQALAFTVVLQQLLELSAGAVGRLLPLALLAALAFVAVNHALVAWLGGVGRFVSVAAVVAAAAGAITSAVPGLFAGLRPFLPLSPALDGFRAAVSGGPGVGGAAGLLFGWLVVAVAFSVLAVARRRMLPATLPGHGVEAAAA